MMWCSLFLAFLVVGVAESHGSWGSRRRRRGGYHCPQCPTVTYTDCFSQYTNAADAVCGPGAKFSIPAASMSAMCRKRCARYPKCASCVISGQAACVADVVCDFAGLGVAPATAPAECTGKVQSGSTAFKLEVTPAAGPATLKLAADVTGQETLAYYLVDSVYTFSATGPYQFCVSVDAKLDLNVKLQAVVFPKAIAESATSAVKDAFAVNTLHTMGRIHGMMIGTQATPATTTKTMTLQIEEDSYLGFIVQIPSSASTTANTEISNFSVVEGACTTP